MKNKKFTSIENIIKVAKKGGMYVLVDDENRENEAIQLFVHQMLMQKKLILWLNMVGDSFV